MTILHSFLNSTDGSWPIGGVVQATNGNLYGVAVGGGLCGDGTVFKISTKGSLITVLHSFSGPDGAYPQGALIQDTDGNLYRTTAGGGARDMGTVFRLNVGLGPFITTLPTFDKAGKTIKILRDESDGCDERHLRWHTGRLYGRFVVANLGHRAGGREDWQGPSGHTGRHAYE